MLVFDMNRLDPHCRRLCFRLEAVDIILFIGLGKGR